MEITGQGIGDDLHGKSLHTANRKGIVFLQVNKNFE